MKANGKLSRVTTLAGFSVGLLLFVHCDTNDDYVDPGRDGSSNGNTNTNANTNTNTNNTYVSDCPGNLGTECSAEMTACVGNCTVNCMEIPGYGWLYGETDCTHLGQCVPGADGNLATCEQSGWGEYCREDDTFVAQCVEGVSISCNWTSGVTTLEECGLDECWSDGPIGGCRDPQDPICTAAAFGPCPCCEGYGCDYVSGICRILEGNECTFSGECHYSETNPLKCLDDGSGVMRCLPPTCIENGDSSIEGGEYCGGAFSDVSCCIAEMTCTEILDDIDQYVGDFCCFGAGATPTVNGSLFTSLCCNGADMYSVCQ